MLTIFLTFLFIVPVIVPHRSAIVSLIVPVIVPSVPLSVPNSFLSVPRLVPLGDIGDIIGDNFGFNGDIFYDTMFFL